MIRAIDSLSWRCFIATPHKWLGRSSWTTGQLVLSLARVTDQRPGSTWQISESVWLLDPLLKLSTKVRGCTQASKRLILQKNTAASGWPMTLEAWATCCKLGQGGVAAPGPKFHPTSLARVPQPSLIQVVNPKSEDYHSRGQGENEPSGRVSTNRSATKSPRSSSSVAPLVPGDIKTAYFTMGNPLGNHPWLVDFPLVDLPEGSIFVDPYFGGRWSMGNSTWLLGPIEHIKIVSTSLLRIQICIYKYIHIYCVYTDIILYNT